MALKFFKPALCGLTKSRGGDRGIVIPIRLRFHYGVMGPFHCAHVVRLFRTRQPMVADGSSTTNTSAINFPRTLAGQIPGGDRGIRTLDTVSCIHDFESCAFNQLCHISGAGIIHAPKHFAR